MKTVHDYLNDPRIIADSSLMSAPEEVRTIHAIRLKHQDETTGLSYTEKAELYRKRTDETYTDLGLALPEYVNLSGQGKLKPQAAASA